MLQKHEFHKSQHESYDSRFGELKTDYIEIKECDCLGGYEELAENLTEKYVRLPSHICSLNLGISFNVQDCSEFQKCLELSFELHFLVFAVRF